MTVSTRLGRTHVEAFCSTGSSPGVSGRLRTRLPFDRLGWRSLDVRYEVHGPAHAPAVVVLGGISANRHLAPTAADPSPGWWPGLVGTARALDPARRRLIGIDWIGPDDFDADDAPPAETRLTTADQARALLAVLARLGVPSAAVVGASYGGMVGLALADLAPDRVSRIVSLCAAHRAHPMATGLRALQRDAVRFGIEVGRPERGLALARAMAMTTYRSPGEFEGRFASDVLPNSEPPRFPVEDYLAARGEDFSRWFGADRFLALSESIDLHRVPRAALPAGSLLVSVDSDALVPSWLVAELAGNRNDIRHHVHASVFGHDAFLKDVDAMSALVSAGLSGQEVAR